MITILLLFAYAINLTILLGGVFYVVYAVGGNFLGIFHHPYLHGYRLFLAFLLPIIWVTFEWQDAIHSISYLLSYKGVVGEDVILNKLYRELLDLSGTIINTIFLVDRITFKD